MHTRLAGQGGAGYNVLINHYIYYGKESFSGFYTY